MWLEYHNVFQNPNDIYVLLINLNEHALQAHFASGLNVFSGGIPFYVDTKILKFVDVCSPLVRTERTECLIGPVVLISCTVQKQVKLSVQLMQYHGLTASLWLVHYTESANSS